MKSIFLLFVIFILSNVSLAAQDGNSADDWVKAVDLLRKAGKLKVKTYPDKTFAGSLSGYYDNDSLVFINSLTDAEATGSETSYYIKDGVLQKAFIMTAEVEPGTWMEYYSKHLKNEECRSCHGKPICIVSTITLLPQPNVESTRNSQPITTSAIEKEKLIDYLRKTSKELAVLLEEL